MRSARSPYLRAIGMLVLLAGPAAAAQELPGSLFGVELGRVYDIGNCRTDTGELPVKACKGVKAELGLGNYYYFEPRETYEEFEYRQRSAAAGSKDFISSFLLFLLPHIPPGESRPAANEYEVVQIGWRQSGIDTNEAYTWAISMCARRQEQLAMDPAITNIIENRLFSCDFTHQDRKLEINANRGVKSYYLKFSDAAYDRKLDEQDASLRRFDFLKKK